MRVNTSLDIRFGLDADCTEDGDDVGNLSKELLDLVERHEMRLYPNIDSPLEVNLETESEPKVVFVDAKLKRDLKNQIVTCLMDSRKCLIGLMSIYQVLIQT